MPDSPLQSDGLRSIFADPSSGLLDSWITQQRTSSDSAASVLDPETTRATSAEFLEKLSRALDHERGHDSWHEVEDFLSELSRARALEGLTPEETAGFILSLKCPVFDGLQEEHENDPKALAASLWESTVLLDDLAMLTFKAFLASREKVIRRQQEELAEISTPVIKIWERIVAVPLVGTLDSARTQLVMEALLDGIVEYEARVAILDITGVPTVDTLVAQYLVKTVAAARLMGADCIISGIRPDIAQTMVQLGVRFEDIPTRATLARAIEEAFSRIGSDPFER